MKKLLTSAFVLMLAGGTVAAQDDPVKARQALMAAAAGAAGIAVPMLKGEMDYQPAVAKAAIATFYGVSTSAHAFFPEGSGADTKAAPKIWEDPAGFQAAFDKFQASAEAAFKASGKDGPADLKAFQQAVGPVLQNCGACHENYRLE
ncbi:cytochrome C556 [Nitratireductor aestuarii]|uniref:Cytochrome C556 n=1 Tax=Nitratireductor aestuarii TaxID=1735103 RepID=A0A916RY76_9HYPH|nr:cytochrome c [Nitratireductor aestuarii]GGA76217.1 cytochrome C556 [Nitratireductor aestuarii]